MNTQELVDSGLRKPVTTGLELSKMYTSFAGVDTRVRIDGKFDGQVQAISFTRFKDQEGQWQVAGTIVRLILNEGAGTLPDRFEELEVLAANEFGAVAVAFSLKNVEIVSCSSGISIDDIVIEETYHYVAREFVPGRAINRVDLEKAKMCKSVHTKHIKLQDDDNKKALIDQALKATKEEPLTFLDDLTKLLDRHKVML